MLQVQHLTKSYKTGTQLYPVLKDISFEVKKGEIVCIAGIDGNGQSELVYGITGLMGIDEGQVFLNGKDITKESIRRKCLDGMGPIFLRTGTSMEWFWITH